MKISLAALAGCVFGASAFGQSINISVMSRYAGTGDWSANFEASPGRRVEVGIFMSGEGVYGFAGATLRLTATGGMGDTAVFADGTSTGRVGPFNFGAATNAIFATADGFRIDAASDVDNINGNAGFTFFQRDPATATPGSFSTMNPSLVFRFDVLLSNNPEIRQINLTLDQLSRDVATYYLQGDSRPRQLAATLISGTIGVAVPAPGVLSMLAGAGFLAARRRSR